MSDHLRAGDRVVILNLFGKEFARGVLKLAPEEGKLCVLVDGDTDSRVFNSPPARAIPEPPPTARKRAISISRPVPTARRGAFVFWTSEQHQPWLLQEAALGRLRQGWGLPGSALVEEGKLVPWHRWRDRYAKDAEAYWQGMVSDEDVASRYEILQRMLEIVPGDLLLVPHLEIANGFTLVKAIERYRHDGGGPADRLPGGIDHDFAHIIGVDWAGRRTYRSDGSAATAAIVGKFNAYRSAVNVVQSAEYAALMHALHGAT